MREQAVSRQEAGAQLELDGCSAVTIKCHLRRHLTSSEKRVNIDGTLGIRFHFRLFVETRYGDECCDFLARAVRTQTEAG